MIVNSNFIAFSVVLHLKMSFVVSCAQFLRKVRWGNIISFAIQLFAYGYARVCATRFFYLRMCQL